MSIAMKMYEVIKKLTSEGYREIKTDSGTGSTILISYNTSTVVKINQDIAYNHFVNFVQKNSGINVPKIQEFELYGEPPYDSNKGFSLVKMEMLLPLDEEESKNYLQWMSSYWAAKKAYTLPSDDFGVLSIIENLVIYAIENGIDIDLDKSTNVMKRSTNEYVITDPFN